MPAAKSVKAKDIPHCDAKLSMTFLSKGVKLQFINLTGLNLYIVWLHMNTHFKLTLHAFT